MPNEIAPGILLLHDEEPDKVAVKYVAWLAVMILFVFVIIWFGKVLHRPGCDISLDQHEHSQKRRRVRYYD
jgi:hypothetical protein